ncbi:MAG: HIT domain-containing protein [Paenalcaligenes sp.]
MFTLHPTLAADTLDIGDLPLCKVLLMNDQHYPWVILVPRQADIREIFDLSNTDQQLLWQETNHVAQRMHEYYQANKMNVATLGNMVPQLHMHVIARHHHDPAWPSPVWGKQPALPYPLSNHEKILSTLRNLLLKS